MFVQPRAALESRELLARVTPAPLHMRSTGATDAA